MTTSFTSWQPPFHNDNLLYVTTSFTSQPPLHNNLLSIRADAADLEIHDYGPEIGFKGNLLPVEGGIQVLSFGSTLGGKFTNEMFHEAKNGTRKQDFWHENGIWEGLDVTQNFTEHGMGSSTFHASSLV